MDNIEETNRYADIDITDDFVVSYVMRQPNICIELLEYFSRAENKNREIFSRKRHRGTYGECGNRQSENIGGNL